MTGRDGTVTCRFTHVYPDGPCLYFTFGGILDKRIALEQFMEVLSTCTAATVEHGGTTTHHHAVGRFHRPFYDKQRPELFAQGAARRQARARSQGHDESGSADRPMNQDLQRKLPLRQSPLRGRPRPRRRHRQVQLLDLRQAALLGRHHQAGGLSPAVRRRRPGGLPVRQQERPSPVLQDLRHPGVRPRLHRADRRRLLFGEPCLPRRSRSDGARRGAGATTWTADTTTGGTRRRKRAISEASIMQIHRQPKRESC